MTEVLVNHRGDDLLQGDLQKTILRQGHKLFGAPAESTTAALTAIDDLERLESLSERLLDVKDWRELLGT